MLGEQGARGGEPSAAGTAVEMGEMGEARGTREGEGEAGDLGRRIA